MRTTRNFTLTDVLYLIDEARDAELCRDITAIQKILQPIWPDIKESPDFDNFDEIIRAELFRICGAFLSFYGNAKNLKDYQVRGKDLLTNAIELFELNQLSEKAAEAKVMLAFCYWQTGEVEECELILQVVEAEFGKDPLHPVYLQIRINRLMTLFWKQEFKAAIRLIEQMNPLMALSTDERLQAMFHNQAGICYRGSKEYEKAAFHLTEAIRFAKQSGNSLFVAINFNNLAFLYKEKRDFKNAYKYINESINRFSEIGHQGYLSHALDTRALIYLDLNKPKKALEAITEAISLFSHGEDFRGLCDALWTKIRILLHIKRSAEAFTVFAELCTIARERIGEKAAESYAKQLDDEIYTIRHLPFMDEMDEFKKTLIRSALVKANGKITGAAKLLQIKHQTLSEILKNQLPGFTVELGLAPRARRRDSGSVSLKRKSRKQAKDAPDYQISQLMLPDTRFSFDFYFPAEKFETFYFDKYVMQNFGIDSGAIVACLQINVKKDVRENMNVLVSTETGFIANKVGFDSFSNVYFILDRQENPIILDNTNVIGAPLGYCLFSEADKSHIEFSKL